MSYIDNSFNSPLCGNLMTQSTGQVPGKPGSSYLPHCLMLGAPTPLVVILVGHCVLAGALAPVYMPPGQYHPFSQVMHVLSPAYCRSGHTQVPSSLLI